MTRFAPKPLIISAVAAVVLVGGLGVIAPRLRPGAHAGHAQVVYYCPMHPTYTSPKPGDCPICNMKLVKREPTADQPSAGQGVPQQTKDICYMHNCPMEKQGKKCPMLVVAKAGEKVTCPICRTHVAEAAATPAGRCALLSVAALAISCLFGLVGFVTETLAYR